ncbi:pyridoxamine 5'-phosphate oxidase [Streptomyces johnsoniae]|uniref:Pyridoxamine 5'-phosphate oxidase n=1 Tax=Streptomyces johnsoniae TaxID=3075532 RepID=A0ABU2S5A8_9ACTN|nr:pyridoxamine 5'-phosphate oxidase [Streptomyces sp. DSM 41886]MDT0444003.1 pyridoxamine 5'-phosphate oxidase [Streptomyces sp. DSM 41886]
MASEKAAAREGAQRKQDVLARLAEDIDLWVSTSGPDGDTCLVPLSFVWHEGVLVVTTRETNPTTVNARRTGRATLALGHTRDVVIIDADAEVVANDRIGDEEGDRFAEKLSWDVRGRPAWTFIRFHPRTVRAWREVNEIPGRHLMRDGTWLV